jgi:hypothetical protein
MEWNLRGLEIVAWIVGARHGEYFSCFGGCKVCGFVVGVGRRKSKQMRGTTPTIGPPYRLIGQLLPSYSSLHAYLHIITIHNRATSICYIVSKQRVKHA